MGFARELGLIVVSIWKLQILELLMVSGHGGPKFSSSVALAAECFGPRNCEAYAVRSRSRVFLSTVGGKTLYC